MKFMIIVSSSLRFPSGNGDVRLLIFRHPAAPIDSTLGSVEVGEAHPNPRDARSEPRQGKADSPLGVADELRGQVNARPTDVE